MKEKYNLGLNWHLTSVWGIFNKPEWIFFFFFSTWEIFCQHKTFRYFWFFFFSVFLFSSNQRNSLHYGVKEKGRFEYPRGYSDITNSGISEEKRPLPQPGHAPKALLVFCEGRARSERLSGPSWEHSAGSMTAMFSVLFLQMKPRNFVPG